METLNNVASAASKAIWGDPESKTEPVSGVKGNTSKGEPYDAGNLEETGQVSSVATPGENPSVATTESFGKPADSSNKPTTSLGEPAPGDESLSPSAIGKPELKHTADAAEHASKPVSGDAAIGGQHDTRAPPSNPENPEENPVPEATLKKPGPKPLETLAKEHGGDAGNVGHSKASRTENPTSSSSLTSEGSGPQKESHGEGTGELYIKSSGLKAEGGDFDASKPGAGREADRLIEEHGGSPPGAVAAKHSSPGGEGSGEKLSLKEKIKAKLHKH